MPEWQKPGSGSPTRKKSKIEPVSLLEYHKKGWGQLGRNGGSTCSGMRGQLGTEYTEYFRVDYTLLYKIATEEIPNGKSTVLELIEKIQKKS